MGQQVSKVYRSLIKRPVQRYNAENRATVVVDKIKDSQAPAMRAPMYKADQEWLEKIRESYPDTREEVKDKNSDLESKLRDVYVTSQGDNPVFVRETPERPLPADRTQYSYDFVPASQRVSNSVRNKVDINRAMDLLSEHMVDPKLNNHQVLADKYNLNPELTEAALKYCGLFQVHTPTPKAEKVKFDPLQAGKDWVEDTQIVERLTAAEIDQERKEKMKELEAKSAKREARNRLLLEEKISDDTSKKS